MLTTIILVACTSNNNLDISEVLAKSETQVEMLEDVKGVVSSFDGKNHIKFRVITEDAIKLDKEQAVRLVKEVNNKVVSIFKEIKLEDYKVNYEIINETEGEISFKWIKEIGNNTINE